jgi:hypothetical protein
MRIGQKIVLVMMLLLVSLICLFPPAKISVVFPRSPDLNSINYGRRFILGGVGEERGSSLSHGLWIRQTTINYKQIPIEILGVTALGFCFFLLSSITRKKKDN